MPASSARLDGFGINRSFLLKALVTVGEGTLSLLLQILNHFRQLCFLFLGELFAAGSVELALEFFDQRLLLGDPLSLLGQLNSQSQKFFHQGGWIPLGLLQEFFFSTAHTHKLSRNFQWSG